jgi:hypothetical protein
MKQPMTIAVIAALLAAPASAQLTENFDEPFADWTTRWLYQNSNLGNYYVVQGNGCNEADRGNNPEGLWLVDSQVCDDPGSIGGPTATIEFDPAFGEMIRTLSFGVEAFVQQDIIVYDVDGNIQGSWIGVSGGGFDFDHADRIEAISDNGIGKIVFDSTNYDLGAIEGNTSVDEFSVELIEGDCYADFTGEGVLDLFDFLAFVNSFNAGEGKANCDNEGGLDLFDFLCFTNAFNAGC